MSVLDRRRCHYDAQFATRAGSTWTTTAIRRTVESHLHDVAPTGRTLTVRWLLYQPTRQMPRPCDVTHRAQQMHHHDRSATDSAQHARNPLTEFNFAPFGTPSTPPTSPT
jgi:hypothetical protein